MPIYIAKRTVIAFITIIVISFFSFIIIQMPAGDYVDFYLDIALCNGMLNERPTPEEEAVIREQFGLNRPMIIQYGDWMWSMFTSGDFGYSYGRLETVGELISDRLPATMWVGAFTLALSWAFAVPVGIYSAVRQHSVGDYTFTFLGFAGIAVPDFLLALVLMYLAYAYFEQSVGGLFSGNYQDADWSMARVWDLVKHLFIPGVVIGTAGTATLIRILRNNLLDELSKPYVVTARSKGLISWKLVLKYPLRVAINPLVSSIGYILPQLIGGTIIVSVVLALPTLGPLLLQALQSQDMMLAGTIVLVLGALTVFGTLISDLLLVVVDPRIKLTDV